MINNNKHKTILKITYYMPMVETKTSTLQRSVDQFTDKILTMTTNNHK